MNSIVPLAVIAGGVALAAISRMGAIPASEFRPYNDGTAKPGRIWFLVAGGIITIVGVAMLISTMIEPGSGVSG